MVEEKNMEHIAEEAKRKVVSMLYGNEVLRERIWFGRSSLDEKLMEQLMKCRNDDGTARQPISYYSNVRTKASVEEEKGGDLIRIKKGKISILISMRPWVSGSLQFRDKGGILENNLSIHAADRIMDKYDCPTIIDEASVSDKGLVRLTWHHCHIEDLPYHDHVGYFLIRKANPVFYWQYTLSGPAQVYMEAIRLIDHFQLHSEND